MPETTSLSTRPNLEYYRKRAKALLRACENGDPLAAGRLAEVAPPGASPRLADAQRIIAREQGFGSWPRFKHYIESVRRADLPRRHPIEPDPSWYEDRAASLLSVSRAGLPIALVIMAECCPRFAGLAPEEISAGGLTLDDARLALAVQHGFPTWEAFMERISALRDGKANDPFMEAFRAVKAGDCARLEALLAEHPWLVSARGTNGNSLLNLATSCRKPAIIQRLLKSGADVDLANDRGYTPLHSAAYGDDREIAEVFLAEDACHERFAHGDGGTPLAFALFWGHREMAERLARLGVAPDNLRMAAGVGDLERAAAWFASDGSLRPGAGAHRAFYRPHSGFPEWNPTDDPQEILDEALTYAARNDRPEMCEFLVGRGASPTAEPYNGNALNWAAGQGAVNALRWLLDHGAPIDIRASMGGVNGLTPLHCAAWGNRVEAARLLVERGADLQAKDPVYGGTPLGWAEYHKRPQVAGYLRGVAQRAPRVTE